MDGVSAIALLVIASFSIDCIARAVLFALGFVPRLGETFADPAGIEDLAKRARAARLRTLVYTAVSAFFGLYVLAYAQDLRIFSILGVGIAPWLDFVVTGLVLMGGAERVGALLDLPLPPTGGGSPEQPIEITGTLVLDERPASRDPAS